MLRRADHEERLAARAPGDDVPELVGGLEEHVEQVAGQQAPHDPSTARARRDPDGTGSATAAPSGASTPRSGSAGLPQRSHRRSVR